MVLSMAALTGCKKDEGTANEDSTSSLGSDPITVIMEVKDHGSMTIELYPDVAPITVENFVKYVKDGFYDGLTFHRIYKDFMIQGGDNGKNDLTPIKGEFTANGFQNDLKHTKGVISMARTQDMNSATSQFFICHGTASHLDGKYAAFGTVVEGFETLDSIASVEVRMNMFGEPSDPVNPVIIEKVYIAE
ncbi:MAG: peptidylprolyl isomerase [Ruminococcaceae bacterium]|nr:peptidylprolyl isomerase [Oscillospiraceae bacterium]